MQSLAQRRLMGPLRLQRFTREEARCFSAGIIAIPNSFYFLRGLFWSGQRELNVGISGDSFDGLYQ